MKKTFLAVCCLAALVSCKKNEGPVGPQGPVGPAGNSSTGNISGKVFQYDQYYVKYTTGLNTTTVSVEGSNATAITDAAGNYTLNNLPAGVYDLVFTKPGNGISKNQQLVFPGAGTLYANGNLIEKPTYTFSSGIVKDTVMSNFPAIKVKVYHNSDTKQRGGMVIIGNSANLDIATPSSYKETIGFSLLPNSTSSETNSSYTFELVNNYPSGTILYAKVYPYSNGNYYNFITSETVFTGYGTPLPTTFTLTMP